MVYLFILIYWGSSIDHLINIYFQTVLSRCREIKDNFESRGPTKLLEYGAYEARLFCEMLLKGSVIILEVFHITRSAYFSIGISFFFHQKKKSIL